MSIDVRRVLHPQEGVASRRQLLAAGLTANDLRRLVRNRHLVAVHPGVYVDHTGAPSWIQRAWAAVLATDGVLSHESAMRVIEGPGRRDRLDSGPVHVAVDRMRKVASPSGVVVHRMSGLSARVVPSSSPPRLRVEEALVDIAAAESRDLAALGRLADAVQARLTTAQRLLAALDGRERVARRTFLASALADIADGTCSVLEREYLARVERPHGLPTPQRQARSIIDRPTIRDIDYPRLGLVIELDGRLFHDNARSRDADLERDLVAAVSESRMTVRLGWGQVIERPCATAARLAALLNSRGWAGQARLCTLCGGFGLPGDPNPPRRG